MRRPTSSDLLYAFHTAALADRRAAPVFDGDPQPGTYAIREAKGGPLVPVRIWMHQVIDPDTGELMEPEMIRCEVAGVPRDAAAIWARCRPISFAHYDALMIARGQSLALQATMVGYDLAASPTLPARRA